MDRGKRRSSERIFLFTLIDLLLQMLFVFFAVLLIADRTNLAEKKIIGEIQSATGARDISEITDKWRRLSEAEDSCKKTKSELEKKNSAYEKKFGALGKPPCLCKGGKCDSAQPV